MQCCYDAETGNTDPHSGKEAEKKMALKKSRQEKFRLKSR
jgi:hypothetical protein